MSDSLPLPEDQLCFALHAASRAMNAVYRPLLAELGVTYPQYLVLLDLWTRGPRSVKELGEDLYLDSGTLSPLLKRLETAGLVRRSRSEADERVVIVCLTEEGRRLRERGRRVSHDLLCAVGLPVEKVVALRDEIRDLTDHLLAAAGDLHRTGDPGAEPVG
ncbi:DNA-binding transcriptional regulator, MarR family [Streptoalloteichus tenebrarius]|uniref:DNA-binding transcriptional regulator, MarR family n=1 Tax=Streptoalloteichus tenebrarius (strain ATCC 17920 / DSM 40477 / JCM 4838 / CBS 697.72 / NBRC 16177 / NCIMB 11028 / NRRL B-12390 / A12253. 1 / ISP 5477) TaxID=1933 RepID=A0ABT1HPD3_STRSD|nr:MarR family transcriptional regulator [Streptoalloteichus tenebrarius]MCP2257369.1 DNA-binding transcriptional regulator, MarR family [Streptoalloteichus tenebrarius]